MEYPGVSNSIAVRPSPLGGLGVFATKYFTSGELIELCPLLPIERTTWMSSPVLADHVVSARSSLTPVALPLGYGALYNHGEDPNASWTVNGETTTMEVRGMSQ